MFSFRPQTLISVILAATIVCTTAVAEEPKPQPPPVSDCHLEFAQLAKKVWQQSPASKTIARSFGSLFGRPISLTEQRALYEALYADTAEEANWWIRNIPTFTPEERYQILSEMPASRMNSIRLAREDALRFRNFRAPGQIGWFSRQERELETVMKSRVRFYDPHDELLFNSFRSIYPQELAQIYADTPVAAHVTKLHSDRARSIKDLSSDQMFAKLTDNPVFSWLDHSQQEYDNAIFAFRNLGKPEMKRFDPRFGHADTDGESNIFSLRMNPEIGLKDGKITMNTNTNLRVLMCADPDGHVHILEVYRKLSSINREGFSAVERQYYKNARERAAKKKIKCVNPAP
jgi:hypothetical protein